MFKRDVEMRTGIATHRDTKKKTIFYDLLITGVFFKKTSMISTVSKDDCKRHLEAIKEVYPELLEQYK